MSLCFPFTLPTAGTLVFSGSIHTVEYRQLLVNADATRARVRDTLKQAKRADRIDSFPVINAIEAYLPYLFTITQALDDGLLRLGSINSQDAPNASNVQNFALVSAWRLSVKPALSSSSKVSFVEPPKVEIASLKYETGMALFTYALALIKSAESSLHSSSNSNSRAGYVEMFGAGNDDDQTKQNVDKWKYVSACLLKADSVFRYLLEQDFPAKFGGHETVVDLSPATLGALITLMAGCIHLATIYKTQEERSTTSYSLYSRVALYAAEQFSAAYQMFASVAATGSGSSSANTNIVTIGSGSEVSRSGAKRIAISTKVKSLKQQLKTVTSGHGGPLLAWLDAAQKYSIGSAQLFMARASYDKNEIGLAIGYLLNAKQSVTTIEKNSDNDNNSNSKKYMFSSSGYRLMDNIELLLKDYQAENDRIAFQQVPKNQDELMQRWPSGRQIVQSQPAWVPPSSLLATAGGEDEEYLSSALAGSGNHNQHGQSNVSSGYY